MSKQTAMFILGIIVIIFLIVGVYFIKDYANQNSNDVVNNIANSDNTNQTSEGKALTELSTKDWVWIPFLAKDMKFIVKCPNDWNILIPTQEPITELQTLVYCTDDNGGPLGSSSIITNYNDTGLDLNGWFTEKLTEMTQRQGSAPEVSQISFNGVQMIEACNSADTGQDYGPPIPTCHTYLHKNSTIFEMKLSDGSKSVAETRQVARAISSTFNLVGDVPSSWKKYSGINSGFELYYP